MLIAVDIGNSSINMGFFEDSGLLVLMMPTHPIRQAAEYAAMVKAYMAENSIEKGHINCIISSVVDTHTPVLAEAFRTLAHGVRDGVRILDSEMDVGIRLAVAEPKAMGADRIASAAAAHEMFRCPVAVVDFGTATTITVVDADGNCRGGAIMAGLGLMNTALGSGTSRLRAVTLDPPASALGKTTPANIQSGLFFGSAGAVERIIDEIEGEMGCDLEVVITGGHGPAVSPFLTRRHMVRPHLVLEGLRIIDGFSRHA